MQTGQTNALIKLQRTGLFPFVTVSVELSLNSYL